MSLAQRPFAITDFGIDVLTHVLSFCAWEDYALLSTHSAFRNLAPWRDMCNWLSQRELVYIPEPNGEKPLAWWRETFVRAFRDFRLTQQPRSSQTYAINVLVRVRPVVKEDRRGAVAEEAETAEPVTQPKLLPLHQRLQMIKMTQSPLGSPLSHSDAMKTLWGHVSGAAIDKDPMQRADVDVVALPRPAGAGAVAAAGERAETDDGEASTHRHRMAANTPELVSVSPQDATLLTCGATGLRQFTFDTVFTGDATQQDVYDAVQSYVGAFLNGANACVVAYGQTGSGKSHTMFGQHADPSDDTSLASAAASLSASPSASASVSAFVSASVSASASPSAAACAAAGAGVGASAGRAADAEPGAAASAAPKQSFSAAYPKGGRGIIPRACAEILHAVHRREREQGITYRLGLSYVEVFGDTVSDLFGGEEIGAWRGVAARAVFEGAALVDVRSQHDLEQLLLLGDAAKKRAATLMNERSSRAHSLLFLNLTQHVEATGADISSTFCFADLGGSEQLKKSGAEGERAKEAININLGLLSLKNVISALVERRAHVPFGDSTLTQLLKHTLGANSRTAVIVTASAAPRHMGETVSSLRFAEACSRVENRSKGGVTSAVLTAALKQLDADIAATEAAIKAQERWESNVVMRSDVVDGQATGGVERILQSTLVGAEEERARLEELLARKRTLLGADRWE